MSTTSTQRAIVLQSRGKPLALEQVPVPIASAGSVVVKVLASSLTSNIRQLLNGETPFWMALPMTLGSGAIGRVESVGPDATILKPGQLVLCDYHIRARDDPAVSILHAAHGFTTEGSQRLMKGEWRNGSWAEYAKYPLENVFVLDEKRLPYSPPDLMWLRHCIIAYGGLADIGLKAGETIIVAPATGHFGGAGVAVAHAMGANIIAVGRHQTSLKALVNTFKERITTVTLQGDVEADTAAMIAACPNPNGADAYIDWSPTAAANSTHISSALGALTVNGRASFMGGIWGNVSIPYGALVIKGIRIVGTFMYSKTQVRELIKLAEVGNLKLGKASGVNVVGPFRLEQIEEAMTAAENNPRWGSTVVVTP